MVAFYEALISMPASTTAASSQIDAPATETDAFPAVEKGAAIRVEDPAPKRRPLAELRTEHDVPPRRSLQPPVPGIEDLALGIDRADKVPLPRRHFDVIVVSAFLASLDDADILHANAHR